MKNITLSQDNTGGLVAVWAIPPTSFLQLRNDYVNHTSTVDFTRTNDIISIPVIQDSDFQFSEVSEESAAGIGYRVNIEGVIPSMCAVNQHTVEELERGEWYVLAVDHNNQSHFCGHEDALMHFKTSKKTGTTGASRNQIVFSFECLQPIRSSIVTNDTI